MLQTREAGRAHQRLVDSGIAGLVSIPLLFVAGVRSPAGVAWLAFSGLAPQPGGVEGSGPLPERPRGNLNLPRVPSNAVIHRTHFRASWHRLASVPTVVVGLCLAGRDGASLRAADLVEAEERVVPLPTTVVADPLGMPIVPLPGSADGSRRRLRPTTGSVRR